MALSGRYELVRRIGAGGMATVWEARDTVLDRAVAVKVVDLAVADDPTLGERLHREAVTAASIAHPDVVTVHDTGLADGVAYVVMTLVEGRDLAAVLADQGPLPVPEALRIGARVAGALAAVHAAGVVHRDVKPANVLLHGAEVTLVDFGIASVETAQATLTAAGTVLGTAHTLSPEQARGEPATPASDVYGLGCLLTAALTGAPPFEAESAVAVLQRHLDDAPPSLRARRAEVPEAVDRLVRSMLAKDPAARPTAADARDRLAAVVQGPDGAATQVLPPTAGAVGATRAGGAPGAGDGTRVLPAAAGPAGAGAGAGAARPGTAPRGSVRPGRGGPVRPGRDAPVRPGRGVPARRRPSSGWAYPVGLGALAIVAVGVLAMALSRGAGPQAAPDPPPAAEQDAGVGQEPRAPAADQQPADPEPVEQPAEPPVDQPAEPAAPSEATAVLAALPEEDREDLAETWDEVVSALEEGKERKAGERLRTLLKDVDELEEDGRLGAQEAEVLRASFVAAAPGAQEDDEDDD